MTFGINTTRDTLNCFKIHSPLTARDREITSDNFEISPCHKSCHYLYKYRIKFLYMSALQSFLFTFRKNVALWVKYQEEIMPLLWSVLKVIFRTDLSYLLSLVFVSLSLVFDHVLFSCFDLLFSLVLEFMLSSRIYYIYIDIQ